MYKNMDFLQVAVNRYRIYILISFRFVIISICFLITFFLEQDKVNFLYDVKIFLFLSVLLLNTIFLVITPFVKNYSYFAIAQILIDLFTETILIYITGGILSAFICLYFVSILIAGMFVSLRVSIFCASFAIVGISSIVIIYYLAILNKTLLPFLNVLPPISFPKENDLGFCRTYLVAQSISFYLIAFLSGRLADVRYKENILHKEILDNLIDGVLVINANHRANYINLEAKKILHLDLEKAYEGISIIKLLDTKTHLDLIKAILMYRTIEYQVVWEYPEETFLLSITITPIKIKNKHKVSVVILKDISYQKRMEDAIKVANRLSSINETATMIAHEIRNPLSSILGASQELIKMFCDEKAKILLDITIKESERIDKIIQDFLEFAGLRKPCFQRSWLTNILKETVLFLEQRKDNGKIEQNIEDNLYIDADPGHLKQVFYNLGINALESCVENRIQIQITAKKILFGDFGLPKNSNFYYSPDDLGILVCFSDNGKGISKNNLSKIFNPFFTTKSGGSGIGLVIVQKILQAHHAHYYVKSTPEKGTNFFIFFPLSKNTHDGLYK